ncbi:MAG TPA: translation initiation factor IF-2 N-terminal domain-containing protein, partial [Thermodesulfobacteriota bacterium]|nr:translation initiation factor IF-2 N-terminal domain-containing protein [Thermodesulfobacteriota bacterium]
MTKSKVLDLAREVGMEDDKLLLKLKRMGVKVKDKAAAEPEKKASPADEKIIGRDSEKEIVEKRIKPTVIRRRTVRLEVKEEIPSPPPLALVETEVAEEKIPKTKEKAEKAEAQAKIPKKVVGKIELEKEEKPQAKPARGRKKKEAPQETAVPVEAKGEEKEVLTPKPVEAVPPKATKLKKVAEESKPEEPPPVKVEAKLLEKEELLERERLGPLAKKKGFIKKRKRIEERMLAEEGEPEKLEEKEVETSFKPFRPIKKKVVLKTPKKTEITVPKPIKRIIRIAEVIAVGDLAKRMGVKGGELIKKLMEMGVLVNI